MAENNNKNNAAHLGNFSTNLLTKNKPYEKPKPITVTKPKEEK